MNFKRRRKSGDEAINVGPFADIAFLLIIFFILTTEFVKPAGNLLDIPSGTSDSSKQSEERLTVNLKPDEILFGENNRRVTLDELRGVLVAENLADKVGDERIVILDSAPDVPYERYFQVVMIISDADGVLALVDHSKGDGR